VPPCYPLSCLHIKVLALVGDLDQHFIFGNVIIFLLCKKIVSNVVPIMQINARATYGLSFGGSSPHIFLPDRSESSTTEASLQRHENSYGPLPNKRGWKLYLLKAYHPLLLHRHRENLRKTKKDVNLATSVKSQMPLVEFKEEGGWAEVQVEDERNKRYILIYRLLIDLVKTTYK